MVSKYSPAYLLIKIFITTASNKAITVQNIFREIYLFKKDRSVELLMLCSVCFNAIYLSLLYSNFFKFSIKAMFIFIFSLKAKEISTAVCKMFSLLIVCFNGKIANASYTSSEIICLLPASRILKIIWKAAGEPNSSRLSSIVHRA